MADTSTNTCIRLQHGLFLNCLVTCSLDGQDCPNELQLADRKAGTRNQGEAVDAVVLTFSNKTRWQADNRCGLCKRGWILDSFRGDCSCVRWKNQATGECHEEGCVGLFPGCQYCSELRCLICNLGHVKDATGTNCVKKELLAENEISNCKDHIMLYAACFECKTGFVLSHDRASCVDVATAPLFMNCKQFSDATNAACKECMPHYKAVVDNTTCVVGSSQRCELQCEKGYYTDWQNSTDPLKQRCVSAFCRTPVLDDLRKCDTCFDRSEMQSYNDWVGKDSFTYINFQGLRQTRHFVHDLETQHCHMNPGDGYYLDWDKTTSTQNQKCEKCHLNCKHCRGKDDYCIKCHDLFDVFGRNPRLAGPYLGV
jgi:hypothetical protein